MKSESLIWVTLYVEERLFFGKSIDEKRKGKAIIEIQFCVKKSCNTFVKFHKIFVSLLQQEVEAMIKAIEAEKQRVAQQWKVISEAKTKLSGKKQRLREDKKLIEDALRKMASIGENTFAFYLSILISTFPKEWLF